MVMEMAMRRFDLFGLRHRREERVAIMEALRLIHAELKKLNVVAQQWNVQPIVETEKIEKATVVTLTEAASQNLIESRQAETDERIKAKFLEQG